MATSNMNAGRFQFNAIRHRTRADFDRLVLNISFMSWAVFVVAHALRIAIDSPTMHLDGAFQTASTLFRVAEGQVPGKDFFPYLGIGPTNLLYPFFRVFGGDLAASQIAAHIVVAAAAAAPWVFCAIVLNGNAGRQRLFISWGLLTHLSLMVLASRSGHAADTIGEIVGLTPGNSLRLVRASGPYWAIGLLLAAEHVKNWRPLIQGLIIGMVAVWSNDYAALTILACILFTQIRALQAGNWSLRGAAFTVGMTVVSASTILLIGTKGHVIELFQYNFRDVATDQWWYFPGYDKIWRIFSVSESATLLYSALNLPCLLTIAWALYRGLKEACVKHLAAGTVGAVLFCGGFLSCIGGHIDYGYFNAVVLWSVAYWLMSATIWVTRGSELPFAKVLARGGVLIASLVLGGAAVSHSSDYWSEKTNAKKDSGRFYVAELGGYLPVSWAEYIGFAKSLPAEARVAEEYWGVLSALRGSFDLGNVDSLIHALGNQRAVAQTTVAKADYLVTTRPKGLVLAETWHPWGFTQNYWFYRSAMSSGVQIAESPTVRVWKMDRATVEGRPMPSLVGECEVSGDGRSIRLAGTKPGYHELTVTYTKPSRSRSLILIQNNILKCNSCKPFASVNTAGGEATIPVYKMETEDESLAMETPGNSGSEVKLQSCSIREVDRAADFELEAPRVALNKFR